MRLSELHTGESGVIVKVNGHGGFRKRIVEMGFIKGNKVDVLLNAPLKDPVKENRRERTERKAATGCKRTARRRFVTQR